MRPVLLVAAAVLAAATAACANQTLPSAGVPTNLPSTSPTTSKAASATTPATSSSSTASAAATTPARTGDAVAYKVTGGGKALTIDWGPADASGAGDRLESVPLPWTKEVPDAGKSSIYQVVVIGGDNVGCTITVNGKVVAQEPAGGSAHCIYQP